MMTRSFTAFLLISLTAACGGSVVFEEDGGGDGGAGGAGTSGTQSTSTQTAQGGGSSTTLSGPTTSVTTTSITTSVVSSVSTGVPACGTLLDDLGGLGQACDSCAESACCGELAVCTQGTQCHDCIFGADCTEQGNQDLQNLGNCFNGSCSQQCNGGCEEFTCNDGSCIGFSQVCNGVFDCGDGSDESPEACGECGPNDFFCNNGACIPQDFVCDGDNDCGDNSDEFCGGPGICDSGLDTGDPNANACLGDVCCAEFESCTSFGANVDACFNCFNQGGGALCDDAIACAQQSGCVGGNTDICGTGYTTADPQVDGCLSDSCCDGWFACLDQGDGPCIDCINGGGGPLCDPFLSCACDSCQLCL